MSDSDRGKRSEAIALTAFCALVLLGMVALAYGLGSLNGRESERRDETPASYRQSAQADAQRACIGRDGAALFECVYERVEASQEQARGEQDLSAQQRAASAALASAVISFFTLIVTMIGVWFVRRTLDATLEAVEDTGKGTDAMIEANLIAKQSAERQQRAYILPSTISISNFGLGDSPTVQITLRNVGTTIAHDVDLDIWFDLFSVDVDEKFMMPAPVEGTSKGPLGPNQGVVGDMTLDRALDEKLYGAWRRNEARLVFFGKVTYLDTFGSQRETGFRYYCSSDKRSPDGAQKIYSAPSGNYAT